MSAELGGKAAERCPAAVAGRACAVIAAGGSGSRLGHAGGKQLLEVAGLPLVSWALRAFDQAASIGHIVIVCPRDRCDEMRACALDPLDLATPVSFAWSGPTRQASTRAGVEAVPASRRATSLPFMMARALSLRPILSTAPLRSSFAAGLTGLCAASRRWTRSKKSTAPDLSQARPIAHGSGRFRRRRCFRSA